MSSKERIEIILNNYKITAKELASSIGMSRADSIYHILNERNGISRSLARKISDKYNISYEWLLTGEGEMLKTDTLPEVISNGVHYLEDIVVVSREAWELIKAQNATIQAQQLALQNQQTTIQTQIETINAQNRTINAQHSTIDTLTKKMGSGTAEAV